MRTVKLLKIDADKCNGCRACEVACAAFHAMPRNSNANPARARIRVLSDPSNGTYIPVRAGANALAECNGRNAYNISGKEYDECVFCGASCPSREIFKEPDSGLPLRCDMCQEAPPASEPMCVQWCASGALTYEERQEEAEEAGKEDGRLQEIHLGLETLARKHGLKKIQDALARIARSHNFQEDEDQ